MNFMLFKKLANFLEQRFQMLHFRKIYVSIILRVPIINSTANLNLKSPLMIQQKIQN
jgi:hypothetical protein